MRLDEIDIGRGVKVAFNDRGEIRLRSSLGQIVLLNEEALKGLVRYAASLGWKIPLLMKEIGDGD